MTTDLPVLAGSLSTVIFVLSALPMLVKAARTKDLSSYSPGNIMLANLGNILYCIYVLHLPMGPAWALHGFHLISTGLMLVWYLRYPAPRIPGGRGRVRPAPQRRPVRFATETSSASGDARGVPRRPAARMPSLARGGVS